MSLNNNKGIFKFITKNMMVKIPKGEINELKIELCDLNFERSKKVNIVLLVISLFLVPLDIINKQKGLWMPGTKYLFCTHILMVLVPLILLLYLYKHKNINTDVKSKQFFIMFFAYFLFLDSTVTSIIDQLIHGEISVFVIGAFLIAVMTNFRPLTSMGLYFINYLVFIIGITFVQKNREILSGHYINGTILVLVAWFLSIVLYNIKVKDFLSKITIEQQKEELEAANEQLTATNQKLQESLLALDESQNIIFTLALALESKDSYSSGHSERVADYAVEIAKYLNLSEEDQLNINRASILHDIGKIGIPDAILNKPSALDHEEWAIMKSHPERGEAICSKLNFAKEILPIIRYHHEHYDGKGYPDALSGEKIPFLARLVSIADTVDAITSSRPYRSAGTFEKACSELQKGSGTQFDPVLVEAFVNLYNNNSAMLNSIRNKVCLS